MDVSKQIQENWIALAISFVALIVSLFGNQIAREGNRIANNALERSDTSISVAERANELARQANQIAEQQAIITEEAFRINEEDYLDKRSIVLNAGIDSSGSALRLFSESEEEFLSATMYFSALRSAKSTYDPLGISGSPLSDTSMAVRSVTFKPEQDVPVDLLLELAVEFGFWCIDLPQIERVKFKYRSAQYLVPVRTILMSVYLDEFGQNRTEVAIYDLFFRYDRPKPLAPFAARVPGSFETIRSDRLKATLESVVRKHRLYQKMVEPPPRDSIVKFVDTAWREMKQYGACDPRLFPDRLHKVRLIGADEVLRRRP